MNDHERSKISAIHDRSSINWGVNRKHISINLIRL